MIKPKSQMPDRLEIDLTGPQGNAFYLLGTAQKLCAQLKEVDPDKYNINTIRDEMQSSDYENLVAVFDKYFGEFVTLYR